MKYLNQFKKYLEFEKRYSSHTLNSYTHDLEQFSLYIKSSLAITIDSDISHFHVRSWIVHLMQDNYTAKSINRKISSLKSYFKFLKKTERIIRNPMAKVISPKLAKRLPKIIREDSLENLFKQMSEDDQDFSSSRDLLMIDLLYSTGMRRSELINLKDSDIDWSLKQLKVLGKGNKQRLIPVAQSILNRIADYQLNRNETFEKLADQYLLVTDKGERLYPKFVYNKVVKNIAQYSTSEKRSPHVLRHSFATHMANNGAELNAIKEILGHANLSATEIYMHNSIDRLKSVYKTAHPKS